MLKNLGSILTYSFIWATSPEEYDYWDRLAEHWTPLIDPRVLKPLLRLHTITYPWVGTNYSESSLYPAFRKLAIYKDRFGQDPPIDLMIELVSGNE